MPGEVGGKFCVAFYVLFVAMKVKHHSPSYGICWKEFYHVDGIRFTEGDIDLFKRAIKPVHICIGQFLGVKQEFFLQVVEYNANAAVDDDDDL